MIARAVSNWHRRQVGREEKEKWINGLAEIYKKQGYKVSVRVGSAQPTNEIRDKIEDVTGLSKQTVTEFLDNKYKQTEKARPKGKPRVKYVKLKSAPTQAD